MGEHGVGAARDRRYCQKEREPAYGQGHVGHARNQDDLSAHQPRIQAPRDTDIGSPFDDCPPIREEGEIVMVERDAQGKVVDAHFTERPQSCRQLLQIKWTRAFMKLYRITTAQADWYPAAALQIAKLALGANPALGIGRTCVQLLASGIPNVEGKNATGKVRPAYQDAQSRSDLEGGYGSGGRR